jgi:hypothetical protein
MNKDWYPTEQEKMTYYVSRLTAKAYDQVDHGIGEDGHLTFPVVVHSICRQHTPPLRARKGTVNQL